jgi:hypothetical protein
MNNTPLHYAAATGNEPILTYLLGKNAQIITSSAGNTPLHVVSRTLVFSKKILFEFRQLKMVNKAHVLY